MMSVLVSQGVYHIGMEAEPGNVLYLDYETDEDTLWEGCRIQLLGKRNQTLR